MKPALFVPTVVIAIGGAGLASISNIDSIDKFGWGENIGWMNWQHDAPSPGDGVVVTATHLAGFVWAENVGWINLGDGTGPYANDPADSSTFGVNIDVKTGDLFGKAWGENIGWIIADTRATQAPNGQQARLDICENRFRGYAWGENIGWLNLDDALHAIGLGPDCSFGDVACDGVISLLDHTSFQNAATGPDVIANCPIFDSDDDGDVDMIDFGAFQRSFNDSAAPRAATPVEAAQGPERAAVSGCSPQSSQVKAPLAQMGEPEFP